MVLAFVLLFILSLEGWLWHCVYSALRGHDVPFATSIGLIVFAALIWRVTLVFFTFLLSRGYRGRAPKTFLQTLAVESAVVVYLYTFAQPLLPLRNLIAGLKRRFDDVFGTPQTSSGPVIVLIHGFVCNSGMWGAMRRHLLQHGFSRVHVLNLDPAYLKMYRSLADFERQLRHILAQEQRAEAVLVGHSMGGVLARVFQHRHPELVYAAISIGAPHAGTDLARLVSSIDTGPARPDSAWLLQFNNTIKAEQQDQRLHSLNIWSEADNIVYPQGNAALGNGVDQKLDNVGHLSLAFSSLALNHVTDYLAQMSEFHEPKSE